MKKHALPFFAFFCSCIFLFPVQSSAQCSWSHLFDSDYDASTLVVNTPTLLTSTVITRAYVVINNPTVGATYRIDLCGASVDTRLSQYAYNSGDPNGGGGAGIAGSDGGCSGDPTDPQLDIVAASADPLVIGINRQNCSTIDNTTNFSLTITDLGPLPVTFGEITAKQQEGNVALSWATLSEVNNRGFEVQRSTDGTNWNRVHFETSEGNSTTRRTYEFLDPLPTPGMRYYRLEQIDMNGSTSYSNTVSLHVENDGTTLRVFPNPTTDRLTVTLLSELEIVDKPKLKMMDLAGKFVLEQELQTLGQLHQVDLEVGGLRPGVYIVQVASGAVVKRERVIIQ